jgi:hypothetical protein
MTAIATDSILPTLTRSTRFGLVSLPEPSHSVKPSLNEEIVLDRQEVLELLAALGTNLGMSLLAPRTEKVDTDRDMGAPLLFGDEALDLCLRQFDMVWTQGGEPVAVFSVETGIDLGHGPRGFADLVALAPKWKGALYLISQPNVQADLLGEMHRPIYRLLKKGLPELVRLLTWSRLQSEVTQLGDRVRYLKPEFLEGISEISVLNLE